MQFTTAHEGKLVNRGLCNVLNKVIKDRKTVFDPYLYWDSVLCGPGNKRVLCCCFFRNKIFYMRNKCNPSVLAYIKGF